MSRPNWSADYPEWLEDTDGTMRIVGSDNIPRSLNEWQEFILGRFALQSSKNKDRSWSVARMQILINVTHAFKKKHILKHPFEENHEIQEGDDAAMNSINDAVNRMQTFFRTALIEAFDNNPTPDGRWNMLERTMESFAGQCHDQTPKPKDNKIGQICLLMYETLRVDGYLIESRKELLALTKGFLGMNDIKPRDVARALDWCKLENICRDNGKG